MAKQPNPNSSYVILDDARVFYDRNTDTVHLTIKDKEIPEGIHLSLNSEREDEKRLRKVLRNHGLLNKSDLMKEYSALQVFARGAEGRPAYMPRDSANCVPFGFSAESPMSWNLKKDPHLLVIGEPGSGKSVTLQNIAEYVRAYGKDVNMSLLYSYNPFDKKNGVNKTVRNIEKAKTIVEERYREIVESIARNEEYTPASQVILIVDELSVIVKDDLEAAKMLLGIVRMGSPVGVHVVASSYGTPSDSVAFYESQEKYTLALDINDAFSAMFNLRTHRASNRFLTAEKALLRILDTGCGMLVNSSGKTLVQIVPYREVMEGTGWLSQRRKISNKR
jgi:hypothetical protein